MKKIITLLLTIMTFYAVGQNKNEKLYIAITKGDTSTVRQLLNDKADPNYIKTEGPWMKVSMLITAVNNGHADIVKMLIEHKADVKWKDGFNTTALMYAASKADKIITSLLLSNGADIDDNDGKGNSVISAAKESKSEEFIKYIENEIKARADK